MSKEFYIIGFYIVFIVISLPMFFQNRRVSRMADEDLKKINYEEWKKQIRSNIYIKMFSRIIWGVIVLSGFIYNFRNIYALGFGWSNVIILALGIAFIVWGILGFRKEIKRVQDLK